MKKLLFAFLTLTLLLSVSCGAAKRDFTAAKNSSEGMSSAEMAGGAPANIAADSKQKLEDSQKVIYNSELMVVVEDLNKFSKEISFKVDEFKGYIEREEIMEQNSFLSIRIPSDKFNEFLAYVQSVSKLKNKRISSQNITDAYVDNESRLKNLKAQENQILEIYKKANTVEDVLKVQNELFRIRGEIEALEGRKKLWDNQIEYATVSINAEKLQAITNNSIGVISGNEFLKSIKKGFVNSTLWIVLGLQKLLIFLISNIIYIIILALVAYLVYKKRNNILKR